MFKDLFTKISTTSVIAVIVIVFGFALMFCIGFFGTGINEALRTQIVQGDWGLMMLAAAYYFSASKQRGVVQNADSINNSPAVGTEDK